MKTMVGILHSLENHWSTLITCKDFMNNILLYYKISQIDLLGLSTHQNMIWLIDY
jgi:hypothetical protein